MKAKTYTETVTRCVECPAYGRDNTTGMFNSTHTGYPHVEMRYIRAKDLEYAVEGWAKLVISQGHEGIVVRSAFSFPWNRFDCNVAKYVRANHVTTDHHWSQQKTVRNIVKEV